MGAEAVRVAVEPAAPVAAAAGVQVGRRLLAQAHGRQELVLWLADPEEEKQKTRLRLRALRQYLNKAQVPPAFKQWLRVAIEELERIEEMLTCARSFLTSTLTIGRQGSPI